jgi:hypothetical protein
MNSEFADDMDLLQLERELQSLTPAVPRRELVQAIKARMEPVPRRVQQRDRVVTFPWRRMVAPAAAAAAAVAVFNLDNGRREGKTPPGTANTVTPAIKWEPMRMLPAYREYLDKGYVLNQNMEFVHPRYAQLFNAPVLRFPDEGDSTMQVTLPRQNRFIVPAGYGSGRTSLRWQ